MHKNNLICVGLTILFMGAAAAPGINANLTNLKRETTTFEINFCTLKGVERLKKEIYNEDAQYLLDLMGGSDYNAIACEFNRLGLLPGDISVKQAEDLINGNYGKENFKDLQDKLKVKPYNNPNIKRNSFCIVSGDAVDNKMTQLTQSVIMLTFVYTIIFLMFLDDYFSRFPWYPADYFGGPLFILGMSLFGIMLGISVIYSKIPLKIMALINAILETTSPSYDKANVNTSGLLGKWWIHEYTIRLNMIGFFGVWLNYDDGMQYLACKFMGFALYVKAIGDDETI